MTKSIIERWFIICTVLAVMFFAFIMSGKAKAQYEILGKISSYIATDNTFGRDKSDIVIYGAGKKLVTITYKGQIVYEEGYDPDVTAKAFWESLNEKRSCK